MNWLSSLPIRVKMIGTTTLLLLFTVGLYGLMNIQDLGKVFDASRAEQEGAVLTAAAADAQNLTGAVAQISAIQIAATAYGDLKALAETLRRQEPRLAFVHITDGTSPVVSEGDRASALKGLTPVEGHPGEIFAAEGVTLLGQGGEPALIRITRPIKGQGTEKIGQVDTGWSVTPLLTRQAQIADRIEGRRETSIFNALFIGGLVVLLGVVLSVIQGLAISRPIRELTESVERLAHGDLGERAAVRGGDEIGVLGRNFNFMAERLGVLLTETKEKATLEKEMEVARLIQESLLPPSQSIDKGWIEFIGFFRSASICGGDWWSYADLIDDQIMLVIGDVTGHGVSSAMITAAAKSCCDTLRHVTEGEVTSTFLLEELNKTIYEAANRKFVMTFFAAIIDPRSKTITFSNAGHNFPLLFRAEAKADEPSIVPLVVRGNRLGDVMQSHFLERTVSYAPGDVLLMYTDGITEGVDEAGAEYGEKRLRRSVQASLGSAAGSIMQKILDDAERFFTDFTQPEDDITLVVARLKQ
ncbi:MAG: SpoIIE family protein phosphatase [Bradymonadia bacterium]